MRYFIRFPRALAYVLLVVLVPGGAVAQQVASAPALKICLSQAQTPTERCLEPRRFGLRLAPVEMKKGTQVDLVFEVSPEDFDMIDVFADLGGRGERTEICIVDGANICPPEPFEIVWVCITTGMLAGSECPPPPENATGPIATIRLRASAR